MKYVRDLKIDFLDYNNYDNYIVINIMQLIQFHIIEIYAFFYNTDKVLAKKHNN
jgi:hypothetical protein